MADFKSAEAKKWVEIWQHAGNALEDIRLQELRAPDYYYRNMHLLNEMLAYAFEHRVVKLSSGLVQQQQIFMKHYHKVS